MSAGRGTRLARGIATAAATVALLGACSAKGSTTVTAGDGNGNMKTVAAARKVVLGTTDLPGYSSTPPPTVDASGTKAASTFQSCAGAASALGDADRSAVSPGFYKGGGTMVASMAVVSPDEAGAEEAMAQLGRDEVAACLTTLFKDVLALDQLPGTATRTERLPASEVSDGSVTWRTTIQVTSKEGSLVGALYSDLTLFRNGRTVAGLFSVQAGTPFPSAERTRLLRSMIDRAD